MRQADGQQEPQYEYDGSRDQRVDFLPTAPELALQANQELMMLAFHAASK